MSRHIPIFIAHSVNIWGMIKRIVGHTISCMKDQGIHIEFKERLNKKEIIYSSTPQEEEISTLMVDSEDEDEEEVWVEVEVRSFFINAHILDIWEGIVKTMYYLQLL